VNLDLVGIAVAVDVSAQRDRLRRRALGRAAPATRSSLLDAASSVPSGNVYVLTGLAGMFIVEPNRPRSVFRT
jgi:hypothetical protein